jgi:hypothetical protein
MDRERQSGGLASPFDHASNAHPAEGLTALIDEDIGAIRSISLLLPVKQLKTVHLVPLKVMNAIRAALEPADDDRAFRQVDVIPTEIASLWHAQTMPVNHQTDQPVPMAVSVALEGGQQLVRFGFGQVLRIR